jgi:hypothetical protein
MLLSHCPICGHKANIISIVTYPLISDEPPVNGKYGHGCLTDKGVIHCSFDEGTYDSREEADEASADVDIEQLNIERREEARMYDDDYFFDYGPPDSDPYDRDGPYF